MDTSEDTLADTQTNHIAPKSPTKEKAQQNTPKLEHKNDANADENEQNKLPDEKTGVAEENEASKVFLMVFQ